MPHSEIHGVGYVRKQFRALFGDEDNAPAVRKRVLPTRCTKDKEVSLGILDMDLDKKHQGGSSTAADASPLTSGAQTLDIRGDLIQIHNSGMDVWISPTELTVSFGAAVSTSYAERRECLRKSHLEDLPRILKTSGFVGRAKDEYCFSVQLHPSPGMGGCELISDDRVYRRYTSVILKSVCIRQPGLSLELDKDRGSIRLGAFPAEPFGQELIQNLDANECFPLFRAPVISADVRSNAHQIDIRWELHKMVGALV
ncbi:hypothetical protein B0H17DRAFT_1106849 [Mycena rosella]|uniref:Uncharacterized protein n=1 Tax=Mycena rosella TaxID=1033263 RepID=A0AAD7C2Q2_MYCRO|nr:hypothetical protein B0H17DRAFT_1106849 [Mycena rosella]